MIKPLLARLQQRHRTVSFPRTEPTLPERFCGKPVIQSTKCQADCTMCMKECPTQAVRRNDSTLSIDLGRCLFCARCAAVCPTGAITFGKDHRLGANSRDNLVLCEQAARQARALDDRARSLFGRSLKLRQVSAGGCNACEADTNVLTTVVFDLGRFGIQFVASPRHADGLLITGPVPLNMRLALEKTYDAVPEPKIVIAVGACAISGGPYIGLPDVCNGADRIVPVDLYIPGCPPHPVTILDGILRLLQKIE
jgi:Ni,Fe-hydrogenase III small subunit/formate hydrogenlyase subunit 6/NADH:ubiquinone oxidoreductase subunit I